MTLAASRALLLAVLATVASSACATAMEPEPSEGEPSGGTASSGGIAGHAGTSVTSGGSAVAGSAARGGTGGAAGSGNGGRTNSGGAGNGGSQSSGGAAGTTANGGSAGGNANGGNANAGSATGGNANGGSATGGTSNQGGGASCEQAAATPLAAMSSNTAVKSDACLSIQIPADQTWIKKVTLQPEGAQYPLPFTWSNCGTHSNAAFTANYGNVVLDSVSSECPILIKLGGSGTSFNVQWWGG